MPHTVVGIGIVYTQPGMHQGRDDIVMSGLMGDLTRYDSRIIVQERHMNLGIGKITVVSPEILLIFIEFLTMVTAYDDDGVFK